MAGGEELDVRAEHLQRAESAVEEDERFTGAEFLVAELNSIDASQIAFGLHDREYPRFDWCAWQESNLLPFGPEPNALSGELQAR